MSPRPVSRSAASSPSRVKPVGSMSTWTLCSRAALRISSASSPKYGCPSSGTANPIMPVRPERRLRAVTLTWYPSWSIAARTRLRVSSRM